MQLDYADFAHFYAESPWSEDQRRDDFEAHVCFLQCLVRYLWRRDPEPNSLGISFDNDAMAVLDALDSKTPLSTTFNCAACEDAGRKTAP